MTKEDVDESDAEGDAVEEEEEEEDEEYPTMPSSSPTSSTSDEKKTDTKNGKPNFQQQRSTKVGR